MLQLRSLLPGHVLDFSQRVHGDLRSEWSEGGVTGRLLRGTQHRFLRRVPLGAELSVFWHVVSLELDSVLLRRSVLQGDDLDRISHVQRDLRRRRNAREERGGLLRRHELRRRSVPRSSDVQGERADLQRRVRVLLQRPLLRSVDHESAVDLQELVRASTWIRVVDQRLLPWAREELSGLVRHTVRLSRHELQQQRGMLLPQLPPHSVRLQLGPSPRANW